MPSAYQPIGSDSMQSDKKLLQDIRYLVVTTILALLSGTILYQLTGTLLFRFNQAVQQSTALPLLPILTQGFPPDLSASLASECLLLTLYTNVKKHFLPPLLPAPSGWKPGCSMPSPLPLDCLRSEHCSPTSATTF